MNLDEYKLVVKERYEVLPQEEKNLLFEVINTPVGVVLGKVLGPELGDIISSPEQTEPPVQSPLEEQQPARRLGLGARV